MYRLVVLDISSSTFLYGHNPGIECDLLGIFRVLKCQQMTESAASSLCAFGDLFLPHVYLAGMLSFVFPLSLLLFTHLSLSNE